MNLWIHLILIQLKSPGCQEIQNNSDIPIDFIDDKVDKADTLISLSDLVDKASEKEEL